MGKYGFRSGYGKFQNLQANTESISATTTDISFPQAMKGTPAVVVTPLVDSSVWVTSVDSSGFKANKSGSAKSFEISWIAFDDAL